MRGRDFPSPSDRLGWGSITSGAISSLFSDCCISGLLNFGSCDSISLVSWSVEDTMSDVSWRLYYMDNVGGSESLPTVYIR